MAVLCLAPASRAQAAGFAVAYIWQRDPSIVGAYAAKVGSLLGPAVRSRLRIVQGGAKYGLLYLRDGDQTSTERVARRQSRLLVRHGLRPATAVAQPRWLVGSAGEIRPAAAALGTPRARRLALARHPASLLHASLPAGRPPIPARPAPRPPAPSPSWRPSVGGALQPRIEAYIAGARRKRLVRQDERTAWSVYDLRADRKLLSVNEDMPLEAASMIKPFIALAFLHEVSEGRLQETPPARRTLERMIRDSDNPSADWVLRQVGGPAAAQRLLTRSHGDLLREMRLVEYIPADGRTYRNRASAHDYGRFLYALWHDAFPEAAELRRLMSLPKRERIARGAGVPSDATVTDKTGTTGRLCGDMGVITSGPSAATPFAYAIVGIIQKGRPERSYRNWMRRCDRVMRAVAGMVYVEVAATKTPLPALAAATSTAAATGSAAPILATPSAAR